MKSRLITVTASVFLALVFTSNVSASISDLEGDQATKSEIKKSKDDGATTVFKCDESCKERVVLLKRMARNGSAEAQTLLAISYKTGEMTEVDHKKAWKWIKPAVRSRYAPALHEASKWYRIGFAKDVDIERANKYLDRAVAQNYSPAQVEKGIMEFNRGNYDSSYILFKSASEVGHPKAKALLAKFSTSSQNMNGSIAESHIDSSENKLTIVASKQDPLVLFDDFVTKLDDMNIYDKRGHSGSRLGYRKCGQPGVACKVIYNRLTDSFEFMDLKISRLFPYTGN